MTDHSMKEQIERIRAMSDDELANAAAKLRKRAELQSALSMADLNVARYEPPSDAVDRVMDRNLDVSSKIAALQKLVREEQQRRPA